MYQQRPHICFVALQAYPLLVDDNRTDFVGGAELQQVIVAKGLAERGFRISMICADYGQEELVEVDGISVFRAYRPNEGLPVLRFIWPRLTTIWSCLRKVDADIYYQRTAGMLTGVVAAYCKRYNKKSIFASAGNPDLTPNTPRIRYWRDRLIYEYGLRNVDRIFVQNCEQAALCRKHLGREPVLIPNCYPAPTISEPVADGYVLWVSTFRTLKRPGMFLDVAEALPQHRFIMIGGPALGEEELFDAMKERAGHIPNVKFLGFVPYASVDKYFRGAAMFVNTSESEGFPNTFLQAWSRGIPTVSFIDAGARMGAKPVGRIVQSIQEMVALINELLMDHEALRREGIRSLSYYTQHHSPSNVLGLYEDALLELRPGF